MKKIISLCLIFAMFCGFALMVPTEAKAYSDTYPLPILTGDLGQDVANVATSQLGYAYNDGTL